MPAGALFKLFTVRSCVDNVITAPLATFTDVVAGITTLLVRVSLLLISSSTAAAEIFVTATSSEENQQLLSGCWPVNEKLPSPEKIW
jgi:hypothetical protein